MRVLHLALRCPVGDLHFAGDHLGQERLANAYPWRIFLDKGVIIAAGSDQPAEIGDPAIAFYAAVARKDLNGFTAEGWHPELVITREKALKTLTIWGAYSAFQDDLIGSIEVGKLADLSILDKNIMTIINGKIVYQK